MKKFISININITKIFAPFNNRFLAYRVREGTPQRSGTRPRSAALVRGGLAKSVGKQKRSHRHTHAHPTSRD